MNKFAKYAKSLRRDVGLADADLAAAMGVSLQGLDNFMSGYVPPSSRAFCALVNSVGLKPAEGCVLPSDELPFQTEAPPAPFSAGSSVFEVTSDALAEHDIAPGALAIICPCSAPASGDVLLVETAGGGPELKIYSTDGERVLLSDDRHELSLSQAAFRKNVRVIGRLRRLVRIFETDTIP